MSMACARSRKGHAGQKFMSPLFQPVAVNENGSAEIANTLIHKARVSHLFISEDKNNALPARIRAHPHAAAPIGLARNAAATAREPMLINQKGRAVSSSGARIHIQPP